MNLVIFVRKGCCICDELKKKLRKIDFIKISNNLNIKEIDIDRFDLYKDKFRKYDYLVPVLGLKFENSEDIIELPPVSPRLKETQLRDWLYKNIDLVLKR